MVREVQYAIITHAVIMKCLINIETQLYYTTATDHQSATVDQLAELPEAVMQRI